MMERVKTWAIVLLTIALITMLVVSITLLPGCMVAPKRVDYNTSECFTAMDCLYRLKDGKDKAACAMLIEACRDVLKEERTKVRLEYCEKYRGDKVLTPETCRLILNQK